MRTDFMLDALEQALHARRNIDGLIHHSDRGTQQYLSIRYGERLAESCIEPSVGTCSSRSATCLRLSSSERTISNSRVTRSRRDSHSDLSGDPVRFTQVMTCALRSLFVETG